MSSTRASNSWLVAYSQALGYPSCNTGLCLGVSHWAGTQLAANNIALLTSLPPLVSRAAALNDLSPDFDVKAVIETINLCAMPAHYNEELFKLNYLLTPTAGLPFTLEYLTPQSEQKENQLPAMQQVYDLFAAYSKKDLLNFFILLGQMAKSETYAAPISVVLSSTTHAICIGYDTKLKHWYFADDSAWECQTENAKLLQIISDDKKIAELVHKTLGSSDTTSFMMKAYAMPASERDMQIFFQKFQAKLNLTIQRHELLHVAAQFGNLNAVIAAIRDGADVNAMNAEGCAPLHLAAYSGNSDIAKRLILAGANLNTRSSSNGQTALMIASWSGHTEFVRLLKQKGALLNLLCHNAMDALDYADLFNRETIATELQPAEINLSAFSLFAHIDSDENIPVNQSVNTPTHS